MWYRPEWPLNGSGDYLQVEGIFSTRRSHRNTTVLTTHIAVFSSFQIAGRMAARNQDVGTLAPIGPRPSRLQTSQFNIWWLTVIPLQQKNYKPRHVPRVLLPRTELEDARIRVAQLFFVLTRGAANLYIF
ncbi:hypothetical protein AHF37_00630 [Paragonimus kellicotti]|nr:hypothetical protein AHF37_00630 [Paragonimus kellicotti]